MSDELRLALRFAWRLAVCAGFTWAVWRIFGSFAFVFAAPLFAVALARPIIDAFAMAGQATRAAALQGLAGRHYAFRGRSVDVWQDGAHQRWLRAADVRRIVRDLPSDAVLLSLYPDRTVLRGRPALAYVLDVALADCLAKAHDGGTRSFLQWLERDVAMPARHLRERAMSRSMNR